MFPDRLFKDTDIVLDDVGELTSALDDINIVCAQFYFVHGMTDATKMLINAFYKLRIKILEMAVRHYEELKESNDYTMSNTDYIIRLAQHQAEIEETKEDYDYFLVTGKIKNN
jgi:hypothetical protein